MRLKPRDTSPCQGAVVGWDSLCCGHSQSTVQDSPRRGGGARMVEEGTLWVGLRLAWSWSGAVRPQGHRAGAVWGEGERARLVDEDVDALQVGDCRHLNAAAPHAALRHASAVGGHARARVPEDLCTSALARINRAAASTAYGCGLYHMHAVCGMHVRVHAVAASAAYGWRAPSLSAASPRW